MIATIPTHASENKMLEALWTLIEGQTVAVRDALTVRLLAEKKKKTEAQQAMVKDSLTRAFNELHAGEVHHDARNIFH